MSKLDVIVKKLTEKVLVPPDFKGSAQEYLATLDPNEKVSSTIQISGWWSVSFSQVAVVSESQVTSHGLCGKASNRTLKEHRDLFQEFVRRYRIPAHSGQFYYTVNLFSASLTWCVEDSTNSSRPAYYLDPRWKLLNIHSSGSPHANTTEIFSEEFRRFVEEKGMRSIGRRTPSEWLKEFFGPNSTASHTQPDGSTILVSDYTVLHPKHGTIRSSKDPPPPPPPAQHQGLNTEASVSNAIVEASAALTAASTDIPVLQPPKRKPPAVGI